ncbi:MRC1 protein, partial [Polypterus senegalus]
MQKVDKITRIRCKVKRGVAKAKEKVYDERLDTKEGEKDLYRFAGQRDRAGKDMQQAWVRSHIESTGVYWIGLNDVASEGQWEWSDGSPYLEEVQYWRPGQPDNWQDDEDCIEITGLDYGRWNDAFCTKSDQYICKKQTAICPPGWNSFNKKCYWFVSNPGLLTSWYEAQEKCYRVGANLVMIKSQAEQYFIDSYLSDFIQNQDFIVTWAPGQPDNWQDDEDCILLYGTDNHSPGYFNDQNCNGANPFICKKGWTQKCGSWDSDPINDYCYLFQSLSLKTWADARLDCLNQKGDLLSITEPFEQAFVQGNPDDYLGEDCLSIRIKDGYWNDDNCEYHRGYICKRRGYTTIYICQDTSATVTCPQDSVIRIQAAMYGRKSNTICSLGPGSSGSCHVEGTLKLVRAICENRMACLLYAGTDNDPCPNVSKYLEVVYSCEQNVCVRGLGMEDGNITNGQISSSSFKNDYGPEHARLKGKSCWMPSNSDGSWIGVEFPEVKKITGIVLQGCPAADNWVKLYKVQISADGSEWVYYEDEDKSTILTGNNDRSTAVTHLFGKPLAVKYIRILPDAYNNQIGLRMDILGCKSDCCIALLDVQNNHIMYMALTVIVGTSLPYSFSYVFADGATSDVWTGLNDLEISNYFTWSSGDTVRFTYWESGEPNNHNGFSENCVEMLQQGWEGYAYSCYWLEETLMTWPKAKAYCQEKKSSLLHIKDIFEQSYFTARLSDFSGFWWIGLRAKGNSVTGIDYEWDNKEPVTFTHWDRDQPDNLEGSCVSMTSGNTGGFWDDQPCESSYKFFCELPRDGISPPPPVTTEAPSENCAPGWKSLKEFSKCYKFFLNDHSLKRSWQSAREDCLNRRAELVSIHDVKHQLYFASQTRNKHIWIGLQHNSIEGGYQWSDNSPVSYTNWGPNEPNNYLGRENCVEMGITANGSSYWNDLNCDAMRDWICQIPKGDQPITPPDPPPDVPGWRKYKEICYYYNDTDITDVYTAIIRCYEEGAQLVSIADEEEQSFLTGMVGKGSVDYAWIGLKEDGITNGEYRWFDMSPLTFVNWAANEPNDANGEEQCVQMSRHAGTWYDMNCGKISAGYICKKYLGNHHTPPPPTQPWPGNCPKDWLLFGNKCFLFKGKHEGKDEFHANWSYAQEWCEQHEANLAVIQNQYENDFVASYLEDIRFPVWIGMSDILHEGKFAWRDGSQVTYTNWNTGEPNNSGDSGEHCVMMFHSIRETGRWNDGGCESALGFVCYKKKSSDIPPPPPSKDCPSGYISWKKNCYLLVEDIDKRTTWLEAQKACEKQKANLASVDHSYEQAFLAGAVLQGRTDAWIGLSREGNGSYRWTDGWPVFYTHWGPGEPTNLAGEGCVTMHSAPLFHGTWNDTSCNAKHAYICKISKEKPPPTPAPGDGMCLDGWHTYGRYCYLVVSEQKGYSWYHARHYCQEGRAELASIHNRAEVEFLLKAEYKKYHNLWIGLSKDLSRHLKSQVYRTHPATIADLKRRIEEEIIGIPVDMLR